MQITWRQSRESIRALSLLAQCSGLSAAKAHRIGQILDAAQKIADESDRKQQELLAKYGLTGSTPYPAETVDQFEQEFFELLDLAESVPNCKLTMAEIEQLSIIVDNRMIPNPLSARDLRALNWLIAAPTEGEDANG